MKDVGGGRVVDDDDFVELSAEATEVLDVVAAVEDARLAEEARVEHVPLVQQVRHRVGVLRAGGSFNCHTPSTVYKKHLIRNIVEIIRNLRNID